MDNQDRRAIEELFGKLAEVERRAGPRDAEAERFIRDRISGQPAAPYLMAQTIVVQEQALNAAQARIEELEYEAANRPAQGGGFLSGIFGGGQPQPRRAGPTGPFGQPRGPAAMPQPGMGMQQPGMAPGMQPGMGAGRFGQAQGGGGFLAGAAQTAMGVAGGVLLGNAIAGMFGGDEAKAAEAPAEPPADAPAEESAADTGGEEGGGFFDSFFGSDEEI